MFAVALLLGSASIAFHASPAVAQHPPDQARVRLQIEGMHCDACASRLHDVLARVEGVLSAHVSFDETRAVVSYDPRRITPARLIHEIEEAGFRARIENG